MFILLYGNGACHRRHHLIFSAHIRTLYAGGDDTAEHSITLGVEIRKGKGIVIRIRIAIYHDVAAHAALVVAAPQETYLRGYGDRITQTIGGGSTQYGVHNHHVIFGNKHIIALRL